MLEQLTIALAEALQDEYKARATYRAIIQKFGPMRPFVNIVEAEERHIQALLPLFGRYGIPVPEDDWPARVTVRNSVAQACKEGVQAEIANGVMYERLLAMTPDYPDVQRVFRNLQRASQENHLPAFQRGVERVFPGETGSGRSDQPASASSRASNMGCGKFGQGKMTSEGSAVATQGFGQRRRRRGRCGG